MVTYVGCDMQVTRDVRLLGGAELGEARGSYLPFSQYKQQHGNTGPPPSPPPRRR
jgi:hypothetical protein